MWTGCKQVGGRGKFTWKACRTRRKSDETGGNRDTKSKGGKGWAKGHDGVEVGLQ